MGKGRSLGPPARGCGPDCRACCSVVMAPRGSQETPAWATGNQRPVLEKLRLLCTNQCECSRKKPITQVVGHSGEGEVGAVFPGLGWTCWPHISHPGKPQAPHFQPIDFRVEKTLFIQGGCPAYGLVFLHPIQMLESQPWNLRMGPYLEIGLSQM